MARILLSLMVALTLAGCQQAAQPKHVSAQSIALQPGDVSDLQRCDGSGDLQTVLRGERSSNPIGYYQNATEWEQWKTQGAIEAYFAAYGRTGADCNALTTVGAGAPSGGLMAALVVKFKNPAIAARTYQAGSTLLGFGPKDITFIRLAGGGVLTGVDTGLGPRSVIGSGSVADTTYYFAFWQNKMVDSFFIAYDLPAAEAEGATKRVNNRIS
jgi:hypothetical protein